jgi:hypothetical protein
LFSLYFVVVARQVGSYDPSASSHNNLSRFMLSGSRGISGVFTTNQGVTTLDLFDLEEDEEGDEEHSVSENDQSMEG